METFVRFAIAHDIDSYGITSHAPVNFPNKWSMRYDDMDEYIQEFKRLKSKYTHDIDLYLGLEVGCSKLGSKNMLGLIEFLFVLTQDFQEDFFFSIF